MKKYTNDEKISVEPFKITISQEVLDDLKERLKHTRWPDEVENTGWDYGTNLGYMKELAEYWQHKYDWRKQEAELNKFALFTAHPAFYLTTCYFVRCLYMITHRLLWKMA